MHLEKGYFMENKLAAPQQRRMSEFLKNEGKDMRWYLNKILKTKERMVLTPSKELLGTMRDGVRHKG